MKRQVLIFGAGAVGLGVIAPTLTRLGWEPIFVRRQGSAPGPSKRRYHLDAGGESEILTATSISSEEVISHIARVHAVITCVGARNLPQIAPSIIAACEQARAEFNRRIPVILCENLPLQSKRRALAAAGLTDLDAGQIHRAIYYGVARLTSPDHIALTDERPLCLEPGGTVEYSRLEELVHSDLFAMSSDFEAEQTLKTGIQLLGHDGFNLLAFATGKARAYDALSLERPRRLIDDAHAFVIKRLGSEHEARVRQRAKRTWALLDRSGFDTVFANNRDPARKLGVGERFGAPLRWVDPQDESREARAVVMIAAAALHYGDQIDAALHGRALSVTAARALQGQAALDGAGCAPLETQLAQLDALAPAMRPKLRYAVTQIRGWR